MMRRLSDRSFMVDLLNYFAIQPVLHDWCNKGRGMYYPVCEMVHIKEPLLIIGKICGFPLSLSEWSFIICPTPYNRKNKICWERRYIKHFLPSFQGWGKFNGKSSIKMRLHFSLNFQKTVLRDFMCEVWYIYSGVEGWGGGGGGSRGSVFI